MLSVCTGTLPHEVDPLVYSMSVEDLCPLCHREVDVYFVCVYRYLPREVDPLVYNMSVEDPGDVTFNQIGGLGEQVRELREVSGTIN